MPNNSESSTIMIALPRSCVLYLTLQYLCFLTMFYIFEVLMFIYLFDILLKHAVPIWIDNINQLKLLKYNYSVALCRPNADYNHK